MSTEYRVSVLRLLSLSYNIHIFLFPYDAWVEEMPGFNFPLSLDFVYKALHQRF